MVEAVHELGGGVAFADTSFSLEADRSLTGEDGVGGVSRGVWRPCCFRSSRLRVVDLNTRPACIPQVVKFLPRK